MKKADDFRKAFGPAEPGFERTIQNTLSSLLTREQKSAFRKLYRFRIPALATALVLFLSVGILAFTGHLGFSIPDQTRSGSAQYTVKPIETALSGGSETVEPDIRETAIGKAIEGYVPGIADQLRPVNLVREDQGIRVELQSALLKDQTEYVLYSVQDLEGSRINGETLGDCLYFADTFGHSKAMTCYSLDYDEAQHKAVFLLKNEMYEPAYAGTRIITLSFTDLIVRETAAVDLVPLLKQYGRETEGVDLPEDAMDTDHPGTTYLKQQKYQKVLDYTKPLNTPLIGSAVLSGIGWVDGRLHVQIHDPDPKSITRGSETLSAGIETRPALNVSVTAKYTDPEGNPTDPEDDILGWSYGKYQEPAWQEFIFEVPPEAADRLELTANLSLLADTVPGKWEFQLKPGLFTDGSDETGKAEEEEDISEFRLWAFFDAWSENDYDRMARLSTPEWNAGETDASGKLRTLMEGRKILAYHINETTGEAGDAERTADCTLLTSRPDSTEPAYEGFVVILKLGADGYYNVDPATLVFPGPREADPAVEMEYLTEEAKINDYLDSSLGDLRNQMVPLNLSVERQGIRLEVISGLAREKKVWLLCAVEDIEGKYNGSYLSPFFTAADYAAYREECVYHDYDGNRYTWLISMEAYNPVNPDYSVLAFSMDQVCPELNARINLNSLLKQYGTAAEGVTPPQLLRNKEDYLPAVPEDLKVLDWRKPLDIPAVGGNHVSGLGWIDGQLHIQFHYAVDALEAPHGITYYSIAYLQNDEHVTVYSPLEWDDDGDGNADWREYVLDCGPEDIDRTDLTVISSSPGEILTDNWTIQFPLSSIYVGTDAPEEDTAGSETEPASRPFEEMLWEYRQSYSESIGTELKPVDLACEQNGVRMEINCALLKDNHSWIIFSLQDLEGKNRFDDEESVSYYLRSTIGTDGQCETRQLFVDRVHQKAAYIWEADCEQISSPANDMVTFSLPEMVLRERKTVDLLPWLKIHRDPVEGIQAPHPLRSEYTQAAVPDNLKVLDYTNPLDIPMTRDGGLLLTGIGWIDGQLHVQFHTPENRMHHTETSSYADWDYWIYNNRLGSYMNLETDFSPVVWDTSPDGLSAWKEYVSDVSPDEMDSMQLILDITHSTEALAGPWEVTLPLSSILAEDDGTDPDSGESAESSYDLSYDDPDSDLYMNYLQKHAVPVNLVCENNGIRFELISAATMGKYLYYSYSLQDLEGDRVNKTVDFSAYEPYAITDLEYRGLSTWRLSENPAKHQAVYCIFLTLDQPLSAGDRPLEIGLDTLYASEGTYTDLLPLLKQYGTTEEGSDLPGDAFVPYSGITSVSDLAAKGIRVLDPGRQLDIPLFGDVTLTGIGWVDGQLHVRLHNADAPDNADLWNINAFSWPTDGMSPFAWFNEYSPIHMDRNSTLEFISGAAPQDADRMELQAEIEHITGTTEGPWNVEVPLSSICLEEVDIKVVADSYDGLKTYYADPNIYYDDPDTYYAEAPTPSPAKYYLNGVSFSLSDDGTACVTGTSESGWKKEKIEIPAAVSGHPVTAIVSGAFTNNPNLKRLTLPDTVESIGSYAFMNSALQSINLPSGITTIGTDAFSGCRSLVCTVTVDSYAFQYCSDSGIGIVFE